MEAQRDEQTRYAEWMATGVRGGERESSVWSAENETDRRHGKSIYRRLHVNTRKHVTEVM